MHRFKPKLAERNFNSVLNWAEYSAGTPLKTSRCFSHWRKSATDNLLDIKKYSTAHFPDSRRSPTRHRCLFLSAGCVFLSRRFHDAIDTCLPLAISAAPVENLYRREWRCSCETLFQWAFSSLEWYFIFPHISSHFISAVFFIVAHVYMIRVRDREASAYNAAPDDMTLTMNQNHVTTGRKEEERKKRSWHQRYTYDIHQLRDRMLRQYPMKVQSTGNRKQLEQSTGSHYFIWTIRHH